MEKLGTTVENLIEYRDQGWKFSTKVVKGHKYITIRRGGKTNSLGPYSDETWRLIKEIDGRYVKETKSYHDGVEASPRATEVTAQDAVVGIKIVKAIRAFGVDPSGALDFIETVYREALNQHLTPEMFVKVAVGMHEVKVEGQRDYLALEEEIREKSSLSEGLGKKVSEYERRRDTLAKANTDAEEKLAETNRILESKAELAGKVKEAEDLSLRPSQLGALVETVRKAGAHHGHGVKDSIDWLVKDLEVNWEPKLGFENEKTRREFELDQVNERIKLAEGSEKITEERVRGQEEALRGLEEFKKHVNAGEIIEFKKMIVDSGSEVSIFRSEVERLGGVTVYVNKVKQDSDMEVARLKLRVMMLSHKVDLLEDSKARLEAEISTLNSEAIKGITDASKVITDAANGLRLDFESPETGYKAKIQGLSREATEEMKEELNKQREAFRKSVGELQKFITDSVSELEAVKKNAWDLGKLIGFNVHLARLARIVAGESVETVARAHK